MNAVPIDPASCLHASDAAEPDDSTIRTIISAQQAAVARHPNATFLRLPGGTHTWTWAEVDSWAASIARSLVAISIGRGQRVGLVMGNRPEFYPIDLAALRIGAIPVSLYQTSSAEQISALGADAGIEVIFTEKVHLDRVLAAAAQLPHVKRTIVVDDEAPTHATSLVDFVAESEGKPIPPIANAEPHDLLTIVYTSGTTGPPKGVMVTNKNVITASVSRRSVIGLPYGCDVISWMPAAHIAERAAGYYDPIIYGLVVTICPEATKIADTLAEVHPAWFFSPPRLWERLQAAVLTQASADADFTVALEAALDGVWRQQRGEDVPMALTRQLRDSDAKYFAPLRQRLGLDNVTACLTGSAPVPIDLVAFWNAVGVPLAECYATTECSIGTLSPRGGIRFGSCGPAGPGVEIKLAADREVMVRSDAVTPGYWRSPDKTAETIVNGWLMTGDLGRISDDGYVSIVDRKKEIIINAAGKNMSPSNIEAAVKWADPLIAEVCVIGNGRPYNIALIVLDPATAAVWADDRDLPDDVAQLAMRPELVAVIQAAVDRGNARLSRVEQVKRFEVLPTTWRPGGDELTMTMKLRRKQIDTKYARLIDDIYARGR